MPPRRRPTLGAAGLLGCARLDQDPNELDPSTLFFYTPRTVTGLTAAVFLLVAASGVFSPERAETDPQKNANRGVWAAIYLFLCYSVLQGPSCSLIRPHPAVWRLVHGVVIVYLCFLVFLMFQTPTDARLFMRHLHPSLGVPVAERTYAADCRLLHPSASSAVRAVVVDVFVLAHTLGWWGKALLLRHRGMLWAASILFEVLESSLNHLLPNFTECWWDRWVLDVLICNHAGIAAGLLTLQYFQAKEYNWVGLSKQPTLLAKVRRAATQLLPHSVEQFDWRATAGPSSFLECAVPVLVVTASELNAFFLKYALWVPPENPINTYRIIIWFAMALPATREYYEYVSQRRRKEQFAKLGHFAWLSLACCAVEILVIVKIGRGMFDSHRLFEWPGLLRPGAFALGSAAIAASAWRISVGRVVRARWEQAKAAAAAAAASGLERGRDGRWRGSDGDVDGDAAAAGERRELLAPSSDAGEGGAGAGGRIDQALRNSSNGVQSASGRGRAGMIGSADDAAACGIAAAGERAAASRPPPQIRRRGLPPPLAAPLSSSGDNDDGDGGQRPRRRRRQLASESPSAGGGLRRSSAAGAPPSEEEHGGRSLSPPPRMGHRELRSHS